MLVGDIVMMVRELIPDVPAAAPAPVPSITVVAATGSTLPAGTYRAEMTQLTPWGESLPSSEVSSLVIGANQGIQANVTFTYPGVTRYRLYLTLAGGAAGSEQWYTESTTLPFTISTTPATMGTPPSRSTAFTPDADGGLYSAYTLFRWLNQGLTEGSRIAGGLMDYAGVSTVQGQPLYTLPGEWLSISDVWYDGFPVGQKARSTMFRRNTVQSSILGAVTVSVRDSRVIAEVWPQPARSAAATTLSAAMGIGDSSASVASTAGFLLPFGFAQIGTEIVSYASLSGGLTGLIRSLGGTAAAAWPLATAVKELNLFINGKRIFTTSYIPGTSALTIPVPAGWDSILVTYMLSKAKQGEQDYAESARLKKQFNEEVTGWARTNRQIAGPRQVSMRYEDFTVANPHPFGGSIIP